MIGIRQHTLSKQLLIGGIFGVVALLTVLGEVTLIHARELWLDETHSALLATKSAAELLAFVRGDVHPPLYFLSLRLWALLFGHSELALRALSLISHLLGAAIFFAALRAIMPPSRALLGATLFLLSPALFYYATEARMYLLGTLWVTVTFACLVAAKKQEERRTRWIVAAAFAGALAAYSHYMALFAVAGMFGASLIALSDFRGAVRYGLVLFGSFFLLWMPWVPTMLAQRARRIAQGSELAQSHRNPEALTFVAANAGTKVVGESKAHAVALNLASLAGVYPARRTLLLAVLALPLLVAAMVGASRLARRDWPVMTAVGAIIGNAAGVVIIGVVSRRYLLFSAPLIIVLMMSGIEVLRLRRRGLWLAAPVAAMLLAIYAAGTLRVLGQAPIKRPTENVARFVAAHADPGDLIVFSSAYGQVPFDYYAHPAGLKARELGFPTSIDDWWHAQPFKGWGGPVITQARLRGFVHDIRQQSRGKSVWLVLFESDYYDPHGALVEALLPNGQDTTSYDGCGATEVCDRIWRVLRIAE